MDCYKIPKDKIKEMLEHWKLVRLEEEGKLTEGEKQENLRCVVDVIELVNSSSVDKLSIKDFK